MNQLQPESIPEDVIADASALVLTAYLVRCKPGRANAVGNYESDRICQKA